MSVLPDQATKSAYVEQMFSRIAAGYDRMNRVMTFGLDQGWRQYAVDVVAPPQAGRALDVGCGTGDFLPQLAARAHQGLVVGIDYTLPMMQAGLAKIAPLGQRGAFVDADALRLPFADESFDALTTGFVMRNVIDIGAAFGEMWRVAKPGGRVACLEVARPKNPLVRLGHGFYFQRVVPIIGRVLGGDATAYAYLPQSAQAFPPPEQLKSIMEQAGWRNVSYTLLGLGAVAV
ncbi:MAG: ubiquinone/menaquinone biosynthesis methyltransferase, partial [Roseiflexaceae bacterium]|nr:ubiquinone/menaquinone biosynthesis methyltransferase [Roseiflexaceae bacterium]